MHKQEPAQKRPREADGSTDGEDDELVLPHTAAGGDDLAGRVRDAEAAIRTLVATLRAERHERKAMARRVGELEDAVHRHKKRVKRAEAELEELREHITQLARGPFSAAAAAVAAAAAESSDGTSPLSPSSSAPNAGRRRREGTRGASRASLASGGSSAASSGSGSVAGAPGSATGTGATGGKREYVALTTAPDPDRPVTDEDKQRIRGNINRLPPERMPPLVSFLQGQLPTIALVLPDDMRIVPNTVEVDFDTLDNRTLRAVDHKVRQALALAGQARRRAERRLLEMQIEQEQQQRHSAVGGLEPLVAAATVATVHSPLPSSL